jgi:hypothetical protein
MARAENIKNNRKNRGLALITLPQEIINNNENENCA